MVAVVLAIIALVLEIVHWAVSRDASLSFYALVALTLGVLLANGIPSLRRR